MEGGRVIRREFSRAVRREVLARANGKCEGPECGAFLKIHEGEYDHILPNELGGEPTVENCRLLCRVCHRIKTKADLGCIRKGARMRDKHDGTWPKSRYRWPKRTFANRSASQ
jgi:5-methylcytosine-specific restriction protein A